jgi:LuxR family maltose regulon positive regulatory protein
VPTPVLATKLYAPTRRPDLVARARLVGELDGTLEPGRRLALVSAPPGFGKTTLLGDWLEHLAQRSVVARVAWVSLDEGDNDVARLLAHVVAALQGAGLEVDGAGLESLPVGSAEVVLTGLVNDLACAGEEAPDERWLLVLDDYHVITAPAVHETLTFLIDHMPEQLRLVVATRSDPPFPLPRLRTRAQLVEVRAADLRFTVSEAQDFLGRMTGLDLSAHDVQALEERTEGWAAGLQLAALSLRGIADRGEVDAFIEAFAGSNRFVIDYLADEVLTRQSAEVRDFLLRTAVLDRLSGSLCDAVTGRTDGGRVLGVLDRDNLFLVPLDDQRAWYRYHHLFADVLRARLQAEQPDLLPELHRRAGEWFAAEGMVVDAVAHALAAEDVDRAAYLIEEALPDMRRARQDAVLLGWARALPGAVVRRSPVLCMISAWAHLMAGELEAVEGRLDDAAAALASGQADESVRSAWAETEDLRTAPATIEVYRASVAQARGDVAGTVEHAQRAVDLAGPDDHFVRGAGSGFLGLAAWAAGDIEGALTTFGEAVRSLHEAGNLVDELDGTVNLADMWLAAGRPSRARRLYEDALRTATRDGASHPRATPVLHVGLADLDRELDDLAGAEAELETARVLGERGSITEGRHRWPVVMAMVRSGRGDHDGALRLLDEAESLYRRGFYPDVRPIAATRARVRIAAGDLEGAAAWAEECEVDLDDEPAYLHEHEHLTLVRLLLARRRPDDVDRALALLDRLHEAALGAARDGSVVEIRMLQSLAHFSTGDVRQALEALGESFAATPEPESYVRLYLDEGGPMVELLRRGAGAGGDLATHASRLLRHAETPRGQGTTASALVDPLSEREREVLRLLDSELTGPQIARQLYVTVNTLRTHTKRIFTKLGVSTRAAAVRRARDHGLL